jgi:membrane-associated phospholipid phosphatase
MTLPFADSQIGDAGDFLLINRFARRTEWLHGPMTFLAEQGLVLFVVLIAIGWFVSRRRGDMPALAATAWAGFGTLIAVGVNQPIVNAVHERRPYTSLPHVLVLVGRSADFSFPSDHATMAGAVAMGLVFVDKRLGIIAWIAAALLAFSRVYVGAHYPHDVVVGLALGAAVVLVGRVAAQPVLTAIANRLVHTRVGPLLAERTRATGG